jgi:hypothetical protein
MIHKLLPILLVVILFTPITSFAQDEYTRYDCPTEESAVDCNNSCKRTDFSHFFAIVNSRTVLEITKLDGMIVSKEDISCSVKGTASFRCIGIHNRRGASTNLYYSKDVKYSIRFDNNTGMNLSYGCWK